MRAVSVLIAASLMLATSTASAQDEEEESFVELDAVQVDMLRKGIAADKAGDFKEAIRLHRAAVALGDSNLALLNLGLAYQHNGDCKQAHEIYKKALIAPKVKEPAPEKVTEAIESFLFDLSQSCPGYLTVACSPSDAKVEVDGKPVACAAETPLEAGTYNVIVAFGDKRQEHSVTLEGLEIKTLEVSLAAPAVEKSVASVAVEKPTQKTGAGDGGELARTPVDPGVSGGTIAGWALVGVGVVGLAGGAFMSLQVDDVNTRADALNQEFTVDPDEVQTLRDEAALNNALQFVGYGVGAVSLGVGAFLLLTSGGSEKPEPAARLSPMVIPGGGGAVWSSPF